MKSIQINANMDSKLRYLFKPPKKLIEEKIAVLKRKYDFQQMLVYSLLNHLKKQREKLQKLMQYCHEQARLTQDKANEIAELKQWVNTAEVKMKESEREKACLMKEINELKRLTYRYGRDGGFSSTIDKLFSGTETSCNSEPTPSPSVPLQDDFDRERATRKTTSPFINTPSGLNVCTGLASLATNSPQSSVNNSVVSEVTTPKMLGLPKKGVNASAGCFLPLRKTPTGLDSQNPYAEVFGRSSSVQRCNNRTPSTKSNVFAVPRFSSGSHATPGYVTQDSIIPRVHNPSTVNRSNV